MIALAAPEGPRARAALSLVEIVFATSLLVILLAGLFATVGSSRTAEAMVRERQAASEAAITKLDELTSVGFDALEVGANQADRAFHAPYKGPTGAVANLLPPRSTAPGVVASRDLNGTDSSGVDRSAMVGHVSISKPSDVPADRDGGAESVDIVDISVYVVWTSIDGSVQRLGVSTRRAR